MSTTHITPTTGRIVWYRGADGEIRPAIVIKGNGPYNADLYAFPLNASDADCGVKSTVTHADPEQEPGCLQSWHWMPYQIGQAKKHQAEAGISEPELVADILPAHVEKIMSQAAAARFTRNFVGGDFGDALNALRAGQRVARAGWNGKGMFAYLVPANAYPAQTGAAKSFFGDGALVPYNAYMALKGVDGTVSTWAPSGSDALAEDWQIVETVASSVPPHQQRVLDEHTELGERCRKLAVFFQTEMFKGLPADEQDRMQRQYDAMMAYAGILIERMAAF